MSVFVQQDPQSRGLRLAGERDDRLAELRRQLAGAEQSMARALTTCHPTRVEEVRAVYQRDIAAILAAIAGAESYYREMLSPSV